MENGNSTIKSYNDANMTPSSNNQQIPPEEEPQNEQPPQQPSNDTPDLAARPEEIPPKSDPFDADEYDMSGKKLMVVFNFETFQDTVDYKFDAPPEREGTMQDVKRIKEVFKDGLGFEVIEHHNLEYSPFWKELVNLKDQEYIGYSCFSIVLLTHGERNGELYATDRQFYLNDVLKLFVGFLPGIPKLFFIQACRGGCVDDGIRMTFTDGGKKVTYKLPSHCDTLVMRSTIEGLVSWRDDRGSWLIQELCNAVQEHHKKHDLLRILTRVNQKIAKYYTSVTDQYETDYKKQMPEITFTLTKMLKF